MQRRTHPYLDWDGPIAWAHRGGASDQPENTMPAFEYAVGLGYRYVETDVQVTADGVLVAFHDDDLSRTCGRPGRISRLPWREVQTARVSGQAPIPLLEDLLGAWPNLRVNIDCKSDAAVAALVSTLRRCAALPRVAVGAFDDRRLRRLRAQLGDELCTSLGPVGVAALRAGLPGHGLNRGAHAAQVPVRQGPVRVVDDSFVRRAHARGLHVHVWTIDDAAEMNRLLDLGVDGLMTDRPAVLRSVLETRGAWT
ncbi:MAG: glycerophosphodiester phosphodiesterase [Ilumatobacteraceae bacterium]